MASSPTSPQPPSGIGGFARDYRGKRMAREIRDYYLIGEDSDWDSALREESGPRFRAIAEALLPELDSWDVPPPHIIYHPSANLQQSTQIFQEVLAERGGLAVVIGGDLVDVFVERAGQEMQVPYFSYFPERQSRDPGRRELKSQLGRREAIRLAEGGKRPFLVAANALHPPFSQNVVSVVYDRLGATWHAAREGPSLLDWQLAAFYEILAPGGLLLIDSKKPVGETGRRANTSTYGMVLRGLHQNSVRDAEIIRPKEGKWSGENYSFVSTEIGTGAGEKYIRLEKVA